MDSNKNLVLKENYSFLVADMDGQVDSGERGIYAMDTRFLSRYYWHFGDDVALYMRHSPRPDSLELHYAALDHHHQLRAFRRRLQLDDGGLFDTIRLENSSYEAQDFKIKLELAADFCDLFEARGWHQLERHIQVETKGQTISFHYHSEDGLVVLAEVSYEAEGFSSELTPDGMCFEGRLEPKAGQEIRVQLRLHNPLAIANERPISYQAWREGFDLANLNRKLDPEHQKVLAQAIDDLRALVLFTKQGMMPAAGIPWFVSAFGRDALITAILSLPHQPALSKGTLAYLAAHQAQAHDGFRNAQPGKILHEMRFGELSRTGRTPHSPYYGTIDASPLFVILLGEYYKASEDLEFVRAMRPHWEAALIWMLDEGDIDGDGFLEFKGAEAGQALAIQSWKDSGDSMCHADGSMASGNIAVSEVQGYAYASYCIAARLYHALNEPSEATTWERRAKDLKNAFHQAFWQADMGTYAMALDGSKTPLRVHNSDAGQLLWTGIVPEEIAPQLVTTLMDDNNFSGWGIRTLGADAARYNPVSYHNGSVWPHDNALIAAGLMAYGFHEEAKCIALANFDAALSQADLRLPELLGGYPRSDAPPIPYPAACRPQAWDAAALVFFASEVL